MSRQARYAREEAPSAGLLAAVPSRTLDGGDVDQWPVALLLDELWLKARRLVIDELNRRGLWRGRERFELERRLKRRFGRTLRGDVLLPVLGAADDSYLRSTAAFAGEPGGVHRGLPLMLAFGYDIGTALAHGATRESAVRHRLGLLCGLFNCGIGLFDALYDRVPHLSHELSGTVDLRSLQAAMSDPRSASEMTEGARTTQIPEARIVLRVVAAFYDALWRFAGEASGSRGWRRLEELLAEAYVAEMRVVAAGAGSVPTQALVDAAVAKAVLPFEVMAQVGYVCVIASCPRGSAIPGNEGQVETGRRLGRVFSMLDDLIDLVHDIEGGAVNAMALRVAGGGAREPAWLARQLLDGPELHDAAAEVSAEVAAAVAAFHVVGANDSADALTLHVQNWTIGDRGDPRSALRRSRPDLIGSLR